MKNLIEYLKQVQIGHADSEAYITKRVNCTMGHYDPHPVLETPFQSQKVYLSLPINVNGYSYEDFLWDFDELLHKNKHLYSEGIALSITYLFLLFNAKQRSTREAWLKFQQNYFTNCKMHMEFPMQIVLSNDEPILKIQDYEIGQMDVKGFINRIQEHTGSDYHLRFSKELGFNMQEKILSFRRFNNRVSVLNLPKFLIDKVIPIQNHVAVFDVYLENLGQAWFEKFWDDLDDQQNTSVALGGVLYDLTFFRDFNFGRGVQVCVITHLGNDPKQGWVIPIDRSVTSVHYDSKTPVVVLNKKVKSYYDALNSGNSPFAQLISILTTFLSNGNRLLFQNKVNEAFLNFWIGLDSILNPKHGANSKELTKRIAAITYQKRNLPFDVYKNYIVELYALRGSLVHAGKDVERSIALELANLLEAILFHLLEMHTKGVTDQNYDLDIWFKDVDELANLLLNNGKHEKLTPVMKRLCLYSF